MTLQKHQAASNNALTLSGTGNQQDQEMVVSGPGYTDGLAIEVIMLSNSGGVDAYGNLADNPDTTPATRDYGHFIEHTEGSAPDRPGHRFGATDTSKNPFVPSTGPTSAYPSLVEEVNPPNGTSWVGVTGVRMDATNGETPGTWSGPGDTWRVWFKSGDPASSGHFSTWILKDFPQTQRAAEHVKVTLVAATWNSGSGRYELRGHTFNDATDMCLVTCYADYSYGTAITLLAQTFPNGTGPAVLVASQEANGVAASYQNNSTTGITNVRAEFGTSMDINTAVTGGSGQDAVYIIVEVSRDEIINPEFIVAGGGGGPFVRQQRVLRGVRMR